MSTALFARTLGHPLIADPVGRAKYLDVPVIGSMPATPAYNYLTLIPQGSAQSQRVGDTVWVKAIEYRYEVITANSDLYNLSRLIIFAWIPNTASLVPGSSSILENPVTQIVQSAYNYEGRHDYRIAYDNIHRSVGSSSALTTRSVLQYNGIMKFSGKGHNVQYNNAVTTGTRHIVTLVMSDSAITPFPELIAWFRVWYTDA